jgi:hypothetical protein
MLVSHLLVGQETAKRRDSRIGSRSDQRPLKFDHALGQSFHGFPLALHVVLRFLRSRFGPRELPEVGIGLFTCVRLSQSEEDV